MVKHVTACFPRNEIGGWSEIEGGWVSCWAELAWIHRVVDMVFPVQGRGENLGWVACRRKHDVSAFGGQPHGELRGRPITDLTSDDPAVYTEPVACCLIQLTPRHTNTRLNTRVALYAYADAYCTCGAVVGRTEHDRWMPRQIGEPRCPREGEALSRGWIESRIPDDWIRRNGFEEGKNCSKVIEIPSPNSTQRSIVRRFNSDIALLSWMWYEVSKEERIKFSVKGEKRGKISGVFGVWASNSCPTPNRGGKLQAGLIQIDIDI